MLLQHCEGVTYYECSSIDSWFEDLLPNIYWAFGQYTQYKSQNLTNELIIINMLIFERSYDDFMILSYDIVIITNLLS